jgi:hypothetical protein
MVGVLLGDGYIAVDQRYDLYYLSFQHSLLQEEYALYKAAVLQEVSGYRCNTYYISAGNKHGSAIRVQITLPKGEGRYYRELFYPNNNKTIARRELNLLNEQALAWWYQDDGSLSVYRNPNTNKTQRHIKWCTHGFTYDEHVIMQRYLEIVWSVKANIRLEKQRYYFLWLGATAARTLIEIVDPYVHQSMRYKLDMKY